MCTGTSVWSAKELSAAGASRRTLARAVESGRLERLRRGVYASAGACVPAKLAAAHGGTIACVTAARHAGLWTLSDDTRTHVWLGAGGHSYKHGGCDCVEHWNDGPMARASAPSPIPLLLRQILGCLGVEDFFVAVESALRKGLLDRPGLAWLQRHTNDAGRRALALVRSDADSGLESLLRWRLRRYRLDVRTQVVIPSTGRVDLLIDGHLIVEADGRENHEAPELRHKDLVRDAHAAMWGYTSLRFDYAMIVHDWDLVERAILARLRRSR